MTTVSFDINNENTTHNGTGYQEATASSTPTYAAVFSHAYSVFFCHHRLPPIDLRATTPPMTIINQPSRQIAARLISASARLHGYASRQAIFISTASGRSPHWTKYERHRSGHQQNDTNNHHQHNRNPRQPNYGPPRVVLPNHNGCMQQHRHPKNATSNSTHPAATRNTENTAPMQIWYPKHGETTGTDHTGWPTMGRYKTKSLNVR